MPSQRLEAIVIPPRPAFACKLFYLDTVQALFFSEEYRPF